MKKLNINSQIGKRLASLALFDRLQSTFNLYPARIAKAFTKLEPGNVDPADLSAKLLFPVCIIFHDTLTNVSRILRGNRPVSLEVRTPHQDTIIKFFDLDAERLAREIESMCRNEGIDKHEAAKYLLEVHVHVVLWALTQAIMITNGQATDGGEL